MRTATSAGRCANSPLRAQRTEPSSCPQPPESSVCLMRPRGRKNQYMDLWCYSALRHAPCVSQETPIPRRYVGWNIRLCISIRGRCINRYDARTVKQEQRNELNPPAVNRPITRWEPVSPEKRRKSASRGYTARPFNAPIPAGRLPELYSVLARTLGLYCETLISELAVGGKYR